MTNLEISTTQKILILWTKNINNVLLSRGTRNLKPNKIPTSWSNTWKIWICSSIYQYILDLFFQSWTAFLNFSNHMLRRSSVVGLYRKCTESRRAMYYVIPVSRRIKTTGLNIWFRPFFGLDIVIESWSGLAPFFF